MYETTYDTQYLRKALKLSDDQLTFFWDEEHGGLYVYGSDSEALISRPKEIYDGALPSGNSVSALNFLRLSRMTGCEEFEEKSEIIFRTFSDDIRSYPIGYSYALMALMFAKSRGQEVVIVSDDFDDAKPFIEGLYDVFRPFTVSLHYKPGDDQLKKLAPFVEPYSAVGGKASAYVCEGFACQAPVTEHETFTHMLQ
jgi:uncharacterized protein YyaL (SSP411 family)